MAFCRGMAEIKKVSERELKDVQVQVLWIVGENDEELQYEKRMEIIGENFEMKIIPNKGHEDGCTDTIHQNWLLEFFMKCKDD